MEDARVPIGVFKIGVLKVAVKKEVFGKHVISPNGRGEVGANGTRFPEGAIEELSLFEVAIGEVYIRKENLKEGYPSAI